MILIGERINGGFKDISQAVKEKDKTVLEKWAQKQAKAGANYIDVNIGAISNKIEDFLWMIESVQAAVSTPISIDCNKISFLKEALKICEKEPLINSTRAPFLLFSPLGYLLFTSQSLFNFPYFFTYIAKNGHGPHLITA